MVGVIHGKWLGFTHVATDWLLWGWSLVFQLASRFATLWALLSLSTTLLFCSFSIFKFTFFSFVKLWCVFIEELSLFFQAWNASCLIFPSYCYHTWNIYVITLGLDVGAELGYLDGSIDGSNDGNLVGLLLGGSLGYTDGKVLSSDEGIKMGLSYGKLIAL